ncbi:MAG: peptidase M23 [Betaproteobacteria bacterium RIFCSPLOWO2_12_FULL_62_13]|nr:MAG: peptidase M23 [Betaproteobacteria bacterium RIFCSPLOWO2_12_FULL_62_13]
MTKRGFTTFALLPVLLFASGAAPAARSAAEAKYELRDLRGKIEALQKRLAGTEDSRSEAADALKETERAISDANRGLRELAHQSRDANQRLAELRAESRRAEETLGRQQALLARVLYQHYLGGEVGPLRLLLNREDPNRIARQLHYFGYISRARADLIGELRVNLARLKELAHETERKAIELAAIAAEQTAQKRRLDREKGARGRLLASIARAIQRQRREIGTLKRDETRLARLVEQLGRIVARTPAPPRLTNERLPDGSADGGLFEGLKGRLSLPVRGELGNRFGSPRPDGGLTWKGLFIAARAGEEVRAIASGRVVFADWLRGFGNLLIIDHGGAYMSLYGYNEALYKRVGEVIHAGEPIATVGNSGGNADSGLYFELRHEGKPFDPLTWVNIQ